MNFQGDLKSNLNTNERTNGLRTSTTNHESSSDRDAHEKRANDDGFVRIGAVLPDALQWPAIARHPILRKGERDEIPAHVRAAVWFRDAGRCKLCLGDSLIDGAPHLDHITPWSAGGADTTDNLRLLCEPHNLERSNFVDGTRQARPATWWCVNCYSREGWDWHYEDKFVTCQIHGNWGCRVVARYQRQALDMLASFVNWHEREPITHANVLAYCAHCDAPGMTDRPL